jgi:hypothetical protein
MVPFIHGLSTRTSTTRICHATVETWRHVPNRNAILRQVLEAKRNREVNKEGRKDPRVERREEETGIEIDMPESFSRPCPAAEAMA